MSRNKSMWKPNQRPTFNLNQRTLTKSEDSEIQPPTSQGVERTTPDEEGHRDSDELISPLEDETFDITRNLIRKISDVEIYKRARWQRGTLTT